MAAKLKSVLQSPTLQLVFKPFIFFGLLFFVWWTDFNLLSLIIFLGGNFLIYIYPLMNSAVYLTSFVALIFLTIFFLHLISTYFWLSLFFIFTATGLLSVLLGLKNGQLTNKTYWYYLFNLFISYLFLSAFFIKADEYFSLKLGMLFIALFFLIREFVKIISGQISREVNILSLAVTFLLVQLTWIVSWLPIGFVAASNLTFIFNYSIINAIILKIESAPINKKTIINNAFIFAVLLLVIIVTSRWKILI